MVIRTCVSLTYKAYRQKGNDAEARDSPVTPRHPSVLDLVTLDCFFWEQGEVVIWPSKWPSKRLITYEETKSWGGNSEREHRKKMMRPVSLIHNSSEHMFCSFFLYFMHLELTTSAMYHHHVELPVENKRCLNTRSWQIQDGLWTELPRTQWFNAAPTHPIKLSGSLSGSCRAWWQPDFFNQAAWGTETQTFRNAQHNHPTATHDLVELNIEVVTRTFNKGEITVDRGREKKIGERGGLPVKKGTFGVCV